MAEKCVVVADYMRNHLVNLGIDDMKISNIPYGAPIDELQLSRKFDSPRIRFLAIGRLTEKKRADLTIRAFGCVVKEFSNVELVIIGAGPMLTRCRSVADTLGISDRVKFLGRRSPDDVYSELRKATVFVQHSMTARNGDMEGWPVAVAEAAASGLPVVATRHASIPDQIEHGVSGLLCDEGDWEQMGKHMMRLAKDSQLRTTMGNAARSHLSRFDVQDQVQKLENVLLEVAENRIRSDVTAYLS